MKKEMKTYKQAMKPKEGWAHADDESMCAALAESIALHCGLKPEIVYEWIRKHYGTDYKTVRHLCLQSQEILYSNLLESIIMDEKYKEKK